MTVQSCRHKSKISLRIILIVGDRSMGTLSWANIQTFALSSWGSLHCVIVWWWWGQRRDFRRTYTYTVLEVGSWSWSHRLACDQLADLVAPVIVSQPLQLWGVDLDLVTSRPLWDPILHRSNRGFCLDEKMDGPASCFLLWPLWIGYHGRRVDVPKTSVMRLNIEISSTITEHQTSYKTSAKVYMSLALLFCCGLSKSSNSGACHRNVFLGVALAAINVMVGGLKSIGVSVGDCLTVPVLEPLAKALPKLATQARLECVIRTLAWTITSAKQPLVINTHNTHAI